jgi:hypothetical protein
MVWAIRHVRQGAQFVELCPSLSGVAGCRSSRPEYRGAKVGECRVSIFTALWA